MSAQRKELKEALLCYTTDTLTDIHMVRTFREKSSKWLLSRETELNMMMDIKERSDNLDLNISHVTQSEEKGSAFWRYMKSKVSMTVDQQRAELVGELTEVLKDTVLGLQELEPFLEAVEKLAATSVHVFSEIPMIRLPGVIGCAYVQVVILAAKQISPLVLEFKSDTERFFEPQLSNVDVLAYQINKYIGTVNDICERFEKSSFSNFCLTTVEKTEIDLSEDLPEDDIQRMLDHINQLVEMRVDPDFRMAYLFQQKQGQHFADEFDERQPQMLKFLDELEESAVQLERMNKGARISTVAGSSVGAVGGVLSIVGLALIPVTMGVSLALTLTGVGLGITSGVNSLVTTATEIGVNNTQQKKASAVLQSFMEDIKSLQDCVDEVTSQTMSRLRDSEVEVAVKVGKMFVTVGALGKGIDSLVDGVSAVRLLRTEELVAGVGSALAEEAAALRNVPRMASDIPDIGQAAAKGAVGLSNAARAGFIALNAIFLGIDVFLISYNSVKLAKGSETQMSLLIQARAQLWRSVVDSWQKVRDSLIAALPTLGKKEAVLEALFYPESEEKKLQEMEEEELAGKYANKEEPSG